VGIFLVPEEDDFFFELVQRVISFNIVRKKQYKGILHEEDIQIHDAELTTSFIKEEQETQGPLSGSNIFIFNQTVMSNFLFGDSGKELIESAKFSSQFKRLSLYTNKYFSKEFYALFMCPSKKLIDQYNREDLLGKLIDKVANNCSFTFTLRCKYPNEQSIPSDIKKEIIDYKKKDMRVSLAGSFFMVFLVVEKQYWHKLLLMRQIVISFIFPLPIYKVWGLDKLLKI
jgi:hypothetical protein